MSTMYTCLALDNRLDLSIQLRIQEIIPGIDESERMVEEAGCSGAVGWITITTRLTQTSSLGKRMEEPTW